MNDIVDFSAPAKFEIEVGGVLNKNLSDFLGGLSISHATNNEKKISLLRGEILDQAALIGILNSLYEMRFPILCVQIIGTKSQRKNDVKPK